jgi:hypothetical protein
MKKSFVIGSWCVALTTLGTSASADLSLAGVAADVTVTSIEATAAAPLTKTGTAKAYSVDFVVDKNAKVSSKKFNLGGMDADEAADPLSKISQANCALYKLTLKVQKKNGTKWDLVYETKVHGEWYKAPVGQVDRCKLKDGWGVAPTMNSKTLNLPTTTTDTYRVTVESGFTAEAWPKNVDTAITKYRKPKITLSFVP